MKEQQPVDLSSRSGQMALIEAVLFVAGNPVSPERLMDYLQMENIEELQEIFTELEKEYQRERRGITIIQSGGGWQLATKGALHESLSDFFTVRRSSRLTIPSLETLSIVAYRQPVTIAEISDLRGVNSIGPVKSLLQKKLIKISGRKKVPGNPLLYATTREFLLYFGLQDLAELPSLEELTEMFEEKEQPSLFVKGSALEEE